MQVNYYLFLLKVRFIIYYINLSFTKFWLCVYVPVSQFCLDFLLLKESKIGVNTVRFQVLIPKPLLP